MYCDDELLNATVEQQSEYMNKQFIDTIIDDKNDSLKEYLISLTTYNSSPYFRIYDADETIGNLAYIEINTKNDEYKKIANNCRCRIIRHIKTKNQNCKSVLVFYTIFLLLMILYSHYFVN